MLDVAAFGDGFVAVGRSSNGPDWHAVMLRSSDGLVWKRDSADETRFAGTELSALAVAGDRLFAIGSTSTDDRGGSRAAVWFTDDAVVWTEASGPFDETRPGSLAGGEDGLLLLGVENSAAEPRAWLSDDGESWEVQPLDLPVATSEASLGALVALSDGWLAVGSVSRGVDAAAAPVIWRSRDGITWSCHVLDAAQFGQASPWELHGSGSSWLAVGGAGNWCGWGASCPGFPIAWASNGLTWSAAITGGELLDSGVAVYATAPGGFIAVSRNQTYASADGISWMQLAESSIDGSEGDGAALTITDDGRLVLVGTRYNGSDVDPWIVFGELSPEDQ